MMNDKVFQLCGKITGLEPSVYWANFDKAEEQIKERYPDAVVVNPVKLCHHITTAYSMSEKEAPYEYYLDVCKASIMSIDCLVTLEDADNSTGAKQEIDEALILGKIVMELGEVLK